MTLGRVRILLAAALSALPALSIASCSGGERADRSPSRASDPDASDADAEAGFDPIPDGGVCCQVTEDLTDDPYWQNGRFGCPSRVPWICNREKPTSCDDPACRVGSTCQGFNGYGVVVACGSPYP